MRSIVMWEVFVKQGKIPLEHRVSGGFHFFAIAHAMREDDGRTDLLSAPIPSGEAGRRKDLLF